MKFNQNDLDRLNRYLSGNYTIEDEEWLTAVFCDKDWEEEIERTLRKQWYTMEENEEDLSCLTNKILCQIHYDINTQTRKIYRSARPGNMIKWIARVAAILILPLTLYSGIHIFRAHKESRLTRIEIKSPAWTQIQFTLPDSTTGWLNSNSTLSYSGDYSHKRNVSLSGEAYFNVKSDKSNPFVVDASEITVKALGTKFNVASYEDENNLEVVLEEGELILANKENSKRSTVVPDELVTYNKKEDKFTAEYVQTKSYVSWKDGKLIFRNDPVDVIARRLGRWYNVDVDIKGHDFDQLRLRATFTDENLEEVLYFLGRSLPIEYRIIEGGITSDNTYSKKKVELTLK